MKIVVIEDEAPARERLTGLLAQLVPDARVVAFIDSVKGATKWFEAHALPDLVLLDVQLADGTAFDLLKLANINCPVIFTTAYNKYALNAFKAKSIDYLLKPIKLHELEAALNKLQEFKTLFSEPQAAYIKKTGEAIEYKKRFLIRVGENIKTLSAEHIAYCSSEYKSTFARSFDGIKYPMDHNLDALEQLLDPQYFFRINRQYLINLKAIKEMKVYSKSRVIVKLDPPVIDLPVVSSERSADFKLWLAGELT